MQIQVGSTNEECKLLGSTDEQRMLTPLDGYPPVEPPVIEREGVVITYQPRASGNERGHDAVTRMGIARRLAALKGFSFGGEYDPASVYKARVFLVPAQTLIGRKEAEAMGIHGEQDFFGGVVPHRFVATKSITHPLVDSRARVPEGWSADFPKQVAASVLDGFSAFDRDDAQRAGEQLLKQGTIRVKRSLGIGGKGQFVVEDAKALGDVLRAIDIDEIASFGVVVEQNLSDVTTCSVGQVNVAGMLASYYGTQGLTRNNSGHDVYGGSELLVVRGDFDALLQLPFPEKARLAIAQALEYDAAAVECYGLMASRRNYDVAQGRDAQGRWRSGVLEQSWRIGGASGAEIGALETLAADPAVRTVRARTVEVYGDSESPPPGAVVYFRGIDEHVGMLTKYAMVDHA